MSKRFHVQLSDEHDAELARLAKERGLSKAALTRLILTRAIRANVAPSEGSFDGSTSGPLGRPAGGAKK